MMGRLAIVAAVASCAAPAPAPSPTPPPPPPPDAAPATAVRVDQAKAEACKQSLDAYNARADDRFEPLLELARCFYDANAIGLAIMLWRQAEQRFPREAGHDAVLALAEAYERADSIKPGFLDKAAEYHERFAKQYATTAKETAQHLEAAMCLWSRAGNAEKARRTADYLEKALRRPRIADPAQHCAAILQTP